MGSVQAVEFIRIVILTITLFGLVVFSGYVKRSRSAVKIVGILTAIVAIPVTIDWPSPRASRERTEATEPITGDGSKRRRNARRRRTCRDCRVLGVRLVPCQSLPAAQRPDQGVL